MWIVWSFIPMLNWIAWMHAGVSTGKIRYSLYGLLYSVPFFFAMMAAESPKLFNVGMTLTTILWVVCLIHVFLKRNEINLHIKYARIKRVQKKMNLEKKVAADYKVFSAIETAIGSSDVNTSNPGMIGDPATKAANFPKPKTQAESQAGASLIDLNTADESTLSALPGVGLILAKKAVSVRGERGGFRDYDDFCDALGLQPHLREKLRPLVIIRAPDAFPPTQQPPEQPELGGRVVDF